MAIPSFKTKLTRENSFKSAPHHLQVKTKSFVDAGFYYTNHEDLVQCYKCKITINDWYSKNSPFSAHRRFSPKCELVQNFDSTPRCKSLWEVLESPNSLVHSIMAPHARRYQRQSQLTVWWNRDQSMEDRLISYYNTYITTELHDFSIRILTRESLGRILTRLSSLHIFNSVGHFVTLDRMYRLTSDYKLVIICINCYALEVIANPEMDDNTRRMVGGQHFTLPRTMVYALMEIQSIWCNKCDIRTFEWFSKQDCTECFTVL